MILFVLWLHLLLQKLVLNQVKVIVKLLLGSWYLATRLWLMTLEMDVSENEISIMHFFTLFILMDIILISVGIVGEQNAWTYSKPNQKW